jgi:hypothetical protein
LRIAQVAGMVRMHADGFAPVELSGRALSWAIGLAG